MKNWLIPAILAAQMQSGGASVFAYNEAIDGDLGDNYLAPRVFAPGVGESTLTGTVSGSDRDLFTITIGSGLSLDSLFLLNYDSQPRTPANLSYLLSQPGPTLAAPPSNSDPYPGGDIGYVGFGEWAEGRNILRFLAVGPPYNNANTLGEGSYAFWVNETSASSDYSFQFNVVPVPEPQVAAMCASAILLICHRRRRR